MDNSDKTKIIYLVRHNKITLLNFEFLKKAKLLLSNLEYYLTKKFVNTCESFNCLGKK